MPDERKRKVNEMLPILELLDLPGMKKAVSLSQSRSTPARPRVNLIHNHKISGIHSYNDGSTSFSWSTQYTGVNDIGSS